MRLSRFKRFKERRAPKALLEQERRLIEGELDQLTADELLCIVEGFEAYHYERRL